MCAPFCAWSFKMLFLFLLNWSTLIISKCNTIWAIRNALFWCHALAPCTFTYFLISCILKLCHSSGCFSHFFPPFYTPSFITPNVKGKHVIQSQNFVLSSFGLWEIKQMSFKRGRKYVKGGLNKKMFYFILNIFLDNGILIN